MTDFHVPRNKNEPDALHACRYLLARMSVHSDYAYHMLDTQALRLCVEAVAAADGVDVHVLADQVTADACRHMKQDRPQIQQLRDELQDLQDELDLLERESANAPTDTPPPRDTSRLWAVQDLLNHCQLTGRQPTTDALARAVAGESLDAALMEMA